MSGTHEFKKPFHKKSTKNTTFKKYESSKKFLLHILEMINVSRHNELMEEETNKWKIQNVRVTKLFVIKLHPFYKFVLMSQMCFYLIIFCVILNLIVLHLIFLVKIKFKHTSDLFSFANRLKDSTNERPDMFLKYWLGCFAKLFFHWKHTLKYVAI